MTAVMIDVRRLDLGDLDAIEVIEQRAYPTPWSRAMFASELAKPTSICLGAFEGTELVGYIVNSRYVDAWHVMNVAVDPDRQRRGVATKLLEERGAIVPPDGDERHLPRARFHAALAGETRSVDELEPLYLRVPDADRSLQ